MVYTLEQLKGDRRGENPTVVTLYRNRENRVQHKSHFTTCQGLLRQLSCSSNFLCQENFYPSQPMLFALKMNKFSRCLILEARKQIKNPSIILANACISLKCLSTFAFTRSKKCVQHTDCSPRADLYVTLGTLNTPSNLIRSH